MQYISQVSFSWLISLPINFGWSIICIWMSQGLEHASFKCLSSVFTFPLRVFKWTSTFEMWFITSWTNRFKPRPYTRHLSGLTSSPSNNVACLLTLAWRWTRITMTLSAEIWRFGYSKPYVISDLIQNTWKTSQVVWKLKIDTRLII